MSDRSKGRADSAHNQDLLAHSFSGALLSNGAALNAGSSGLTVTPVAFGASSGFAPLPVAPLVLGGHQAQASVGTSGFSLSFGLGASSMVTTGNLAALGMTNAAGTAMSAKFQMGLADLYIASQVGGVSQLNGLAEFNALKQVAGSNSLLQMYVEGADVHGRGGHAMVAVDFVAADGNGAALLSQLYALGLTHGGAYGAMAGGFIPVDQLGALAKMGALAFARPVYAMTDVGLTTSQDVQAMNVDHTYSDFGFDGSGIKIGIISDSFNTRSSPITDYAQDVTNGDLPAGITILLDSSTAGTDEGRGMAQQAYDIAPNAAFAFHTALGGQAIFASGIAALNAAGCDIIVDDVRYFAEPMFQDGVIAQAVDAAVAGGSMYFSSAGNYADNSYMSAFVDSGQTVVNGGITYKMMDFDPGAGVDTLLRCTQSSASTYDLQWDQPFKSVSPGSSGATSDLALFFYTTTGTLIGKIDGANVGFDPIEIAQLSGGGALDIAIGVRDTTANPGLIKLDVLNSGFQFNEYDTHSATAWGHNNAAGAIAVAASDWVDNDRFSSPYISGQAFPYAEIFTSKGGQQILFDTAGNLLASPLYRDNVKFTASDGGNTSFFGTDVSYDADTFPNFYGTSSAAPNAAAIAALLMQAFPTATLTQITSALASSAIDIQVDYNNNATGAGTDLTTGAGLIQSDVALALLHTLFAPTPNNDAVSTTESTTLSSGNVFIDNGSGADTDPNNILFVTEVNGAGPDVGTQITLPSGALLTLNHNGTFGYDPNHVFDYLPSAASGAPSSATDTFTYTLHGGGSATVTVTINGVDSNDILEGSAGSDTYDGGIGDDDFEMQNSGNDNVSGGSGDDIFKFRTFLTAADTINGGIGNDTLRLNGDYGAGLTLGVTTLTSVERLLMIPGHSYSLTSNDANVAAGELLMVIGNSLTVGDSLTFDGSAETDGHFDFRGGAGDDYLTGGAQSDTFRLDYDSNDTANGGGGDDIFRLGDTLTAADAVDGGTGNDLLILNGDYSAGLTFAATTMIGVEKLQLTRGNDYTLTTNDATVAAGALLTVSAATFNATDALTFDGSAESDGRFKLLGGAGDDVLTGGAGIDVLNGGSGNNTLTGGGSHDFLHAGSGSDIFAYGAASDSTGATYDTIFGFDAATDRIDVTNTIHGVSSAITTGRLGLSHFDSDLAAVVIDTKIGVDGAVLFTPDKGSLAGHTFLVIDTNFVAGYQAGQDVVILLDGATNLGSLSTANFI